ncbi:MAG: M23 family metallopeptidase [Bacilli bacterium]|nr:M23 family metallopeptidase [Bacilli bacterium]
MNRISKLLSKFLVFIIIVLTCMIVLKSNVKLRSYVYKNVFQKNLKFAKIDELYEKYFGSIMPDNEVKTVSVEKLNYSKKEEYNNGVKLKVSESYIVPNLRNGIVTSIENKDGKNNVVIEDADGVQINYSLLKEVKVSMYDYVKKGDTIGSVDNELIIEFTKDGKKVDYKKYI